MNEVFAACFEGQFGPLFSPGVPYLAGQLDAMKNVAAKAYEYQDVHNALVDIENYRAKGRKIMLAGYSLGCSTITWIQQYYKVDLLIAIAESTRALNYNITKNTARSILYYGSDFLSSGGQTAGFTVKIPVNNTLVPVLEHLTMDVTKSVIDGILAECVKLRGA